MVRRKYMLMLLVISLRSKQRDINYHLLYSLYVYTVTASLYILGTCIKVGRSRTNRITRLLSVKLLPKSIFSWIYKLNTILFFDYGFEVDFQNNSPL